MEADRVFDRAVASGVAEGVSCVHPVFSCVLCVPLLSMFSDV